MTEQIPKEKKTSWWGQLRRGIKALFIFVPIILIVVILALTGHMPGMRSEKSIDIAKFTSDNSSINKTMDVPKLPVPKVDAIEYSTIKVPETSCIYWIWMANAPLFTSNGGNITTAGSIMEACGVRLKLRCNNSTDFMKSEQLAFINAYAKGDQNPTVGSPLVTLMGDGIPGYISVMNANITKTVGKKFCLKVVGMWGWSLGEDCGMGNKKFLENKASLKGAIFIAVIGDGDWGLIVRLAGDNTDPEDPKGGSIRVNPDPGTYDPNAINFVQAPEGDFLKAADQYIAGTTVKLKIKDKNGKLTGEEKEFVPDGCATWLPGDLNCVRQTGAVKFISTKEYPNQMACVLVGPDQWMKDHKSTVVGILNAALTASNQIKMYDDWYHYAADLAPGCFYANANEAPFKSRDWYTYSHSGGTMLDPDGNPIVNKNGDRVSVGGSQYANLVDARQYFGIDGGNNYYKAVYEYFAGVITKLNPMNIMADVDKIPSYDDAVDLSYLKDVHVISGKLTEADLSKNTGTVFSNKEWHIEFIVGSAAITREGASELEKIYNQMLVSSSAIVDLKGHTDNTGNPSSNDVLSLQRANAVKVWLINRSSGKFTDKNFGLVAGAGSREPVDPKANNNLKANRDRNRRVSVQFKN